MNDPAPHKLLIIGSVWPEPSSSAAGQRMMQLLEFFQRDKWQITFASAAEKGKRAVDFSAQNVETQPIKINDSSFDEFVAALQPDAVLFDRFITEEQFGWRVTEQCPGALLILDTEDLHCLRRARRKALYEGRKFVRDDLLNEDTAKREIASIYRCDLSLIISEFEYQLLVSLFGIQETLLLYLPFLLEPIDEGAVDSWPSFDERDHFVTIGNFRHRPNRDAVHYLYQSIWPGIRSRLPNAKIHVFGAYPSKKAKKLHQPNEGFFIEGQVDDAKQAIQKARVLLAFLRFGAGLKGKLTEAIQCGTPTVTTPVGAEGIKGGKKWGGFIRKDPDEFVNSTVKLYNERRIWEEAQSGGIEIINERFDRNKFETVLADRIREIRQNLEAYRRQNFMGSMLKHHTITGTKYMAKWIEAKNANTSGRR